MYSAVALSDPPKLIWITTTAVGTAHSPCNGKAKRCTKPNARSALIVARRQKRRRDLLRGEFRCVMLLHHSGSSEDAIGSQVDIANLKPQVATVNFTYP